MKKIRWENSTTQAEILLMVNSILTDENLESSEQFLRNASPNNTAVIFLVNESLTEVQIWEITYFCTKIFLVLGFSYS